jgi:hypothetical protein
MVWEEGNGDVRDFLDSARGVPLLIVGAAQRKGEPVEPPDTRPRFRGLPD